MTFDLFADLPSPLDEPVKVAIFDDVVPAAEAELERARFRLAEVRAKYKDVLWPLPAQIDEIRAAELAVELLRGSITDEEIDEPETACNPHASETSKKPLVEPEIACKPHAYVLEPAGLNRWNYRGELLTYDLKKQAVEGRGRWAWGVIRSDGHVALCKAIDERLGALEEV